MPRLFYCSCKLSVACGFFVMLAISSKLLYRHYITYVPPMPNLTNQYWGKGEPHPDSTDVLPYLIAVEEHMIEDLKDSLEVELSSLKDWRPVPGMATWPYAIPLTFLKAVFHYWIKKYDWNQRQNLLNQYPQYATEIQGLYIHFYHVKPRQPEGQKLRVLPLLMVHGWPGSIVEFQKVIPLLTQPTADRDFVFELIIPSLPGFGLSEKPHKNGLGPAQMTVILKNLMDRLGFEKYYVQGGGWGGLLTSYMAALFPQKIIGAHSNTCTVNTILYLTYGSIRAITPFVEIDQAHDSAMDAIYHHINKAVYYQTSDHKLPMAEEIVEKNITQSPLAFAAYMLDHFYTLTTQRKRPAGSLLDYFTMDELLDNLMIYWVSDSIRSCQRIYAETEKEEHRQLEIDHKPIIVPTACAMFPNEAFHYPEWILNHGRYKKLIQYTQPPRGGHFAALEVPKIFAEDVWSFVQKNEELLVKPTVP